jgi:ribose 5-phosphate isomerase A
MVVGLGTGSTAYFAVERVGQKIKSGELKNIICIPTSERTKEQALSLGIPLVTLNEQSKLDVAIDGADDVDKKLNLVKGGGGELMVPVWQLRCSSLDLDSALHTVHELTPFLQST